jgi:ectoine hydroxylase-related dioxygenase (phytanoyl-CoA dioxygenase family)
MSKQLVEAGYTVIPDLIEGEELAEITRYVDALITNGSGMRRLIDVQWCAALAQRLAGGDRVRQELPPEATPVQCTLFAKSIERNWLVSLHQDLSIPVAERVASQECSGWSEKEGQIFVQPPIQVLEKLLAVRIHLDDCDERSGALRVIPGSHRLGRLSPGEALQLRTERGEASVGVGRGGAMLMRPLLLHASSKVAGNKARRVLHFVFGPGNLPLGLRWPSQRSS